MIHSVNGIIQAQKKQAITLAVGPLSLELAVADESAFQMGSACTVFTYLHWNQENGPSLYGFQKEIDRALFLLVTSCNGVGPRLGLAVLADIGVSGFVSAIQKGDDRILSKVSGIGPKKAEQIIVQLKHKIDGFIELGIDLGVENNDLIDWHTISDALKALNYSRTEITQAMSYLRTKKSDTTQSFDQLLRHALSFLSKSVQQ